jgi:MerR HTH family regulatory protein
VGEVAEKGLTLPEIAKRAGLEYRTLKSWVDEGMLGYVEKRGAGHPVLFTERTARIVVTLARLRERGLTLSRLFVVARELLLHDWAICPICDSDLHLAAPREEQR